MKALYWRIYLTLVLVLAAFAFGSAWLFQRQIEQERGHVESAVSDRTQAIAQLIQRVLPPATAARAEQAQVFEDWAQRLRMAIALDDAKGRRIATSEAFERREETGDTARMVQIVLDDGRRISFVRPQRPPPGFAQGGQEGGAARLAEGRGLRREEPHWPGFGPLGHRPNGQVLVILLLLLFVGVAAGAFPVVRRLTRRLEALKAGVEQFGAGKLSHRVHDEGRDEVAALASSFNQAAARIEALLHSHQSLLANASHELRSPLARLKMAFAMLDEASGAQRERLQREIHTNIAELDALVEEVLLASRLEADAQQGSGGKEPVHILAVAAEEAARSGAELDAEDDAISTLRISGEERLLRRALRNLLENARRYGGGEVLLRLRQQGQRLELRVCDRGPGVPEAMRERIFEAFFRLPGHAEQAGGVGLGLSLVKQIAQRHQGTVRCEAREGGGSEFVLSLPLAG
ncbi:ATP-binding protein [Paucibacter sp. APW11]|uniref:histidine kinase n=1 Tax=Roseateles aquae TaxID=3077235 RepID=A0ABU3P8M5_9BURK|nr:ATP-binding protein [Paucibacter sp. APW11]MDT8998926.1 ATP-binding protein [Paucibacter sp. APW11]